jgi:hypothetical protein
MNSWYKEAYLQFFDPDKNLFIETPDRITGIYISYNSGDIDSKIPNEQVAYSGLSIPFFKNNQIIAYPVVIGQLLSSVGPGINIGELNSADSPYSIRQSGDKGEIILGNANGIVSGVENINIGNFNLIAQSKQMNVMGRNNYTNHCKYTYILGASNILSGIYLSNILGKNNNLVANNDVNNVDPSIFSGYETRLINIIGDYNFIYSGGMSDSIFGNFNNLNNSAFISVYGNLNGISFTSGDYNLILGDRNHAYNSINISMIGNENTIDLGNSDFILGKSNYVNSGYANHVYGRTNTIHEGSLNTLVGNSNEILGSYNQIFGSNMINYPNSVNSTIVGDSNHLSGDFNNYIFGSNTTCDSTILEETIPDFPALTEILSRTTGFAGDYNYYIGDNNRNTANDYSFVLGESNNSIDNFKSFVIGSNNKSVSNINSYILGNSNQITGSSNSIFLGFNFVSGTSQQGISGFGIKISPSGIDIYGTLRVNGTVINIP